MEQYDGRNNTVITGIPDHLSCWYKLEDTVTSILMEDVDVIIYSKWWYWGIDAAIELGNLT